MYDIYEFDDDRDGTVIYIGVTNNLARRTKEHLSSQGMLYPLALEFRAEGLELEPHVLDSHTDLQEARNLEKKHIQEKKPLLNTIHNLEFIRERREIEEYNNIIRSLMKSAGFSYKDAVIYDWNFNRSQGDNSDYNLIRETAQLVRRISGKSPFTETEILNIALGVRSNKSSY